MKVKDLPICKKCKNKSDLDCPTCGKRRSRILFEMECIENKREFYKRVHFLLCKYRMESTGTATLDMEILDNCGPWLEKLPLANPLHNFYERLKVSTILELFHLFKFLGVSHPEFIKRYNEYLKTKQEGIQRIITENNIIFN